MTQRDPQDELRELLGAAKRHIDEPLPRVVEERVLARLRPEFVKPPHRFAWPLVFAAVAAAVTLAFVVYRPLRQPLVSVAARAGSVVVDPAIKQIDTSPGGRLQLALPQARVTTLADTSLHVAEANSRAIHLVVEHGAAVADVDPRSQPRIFEVALPHALVRITGTLFYVSASADTSQIAVAHGHVRVAAAMGELAVDGGQLVEIHENGRVVRRSLSPNEADSIRGALEVSTWTSPSIEALSAGMVIADNVEPAPPMPPNEPVQPRAPPPRSHHSDLKKPPPADRFAEVTELLAKHDCAGARAKLEIMAASDDASRPWYATAQCFHAARRVEDALAVYGIIVERFPHAAVTENADYEAARLTRELGRGEAAEAAFKDYLSRYPRGALAQEAFFWRCHLAASNGRPDDAISCLRDFRERFPKSARAVETLFSEATLLRTAKKDCATALSVYNQYLAADGAHREQATSWRDWCESHSP